MMQTVKNKKCQAAEKTSPGMQQQFRYQKDHPDAFATEWEIFTNYFHEDAVNAAQILRLPNLTE